MAAHDGKLALKKDSRLLGWHTAQGEYSQIKYDTQRSHTNGKLRKKAPVWKAQQQKNILLTSFWIFLNLPLLQTASRSPK